MLVFHYCNEWLRVIYKELYLQIKRHKLREDAVGLEGNNQIYHAAEHEQAHH